MIKKLIISVLLTSGLYNPAFSAGLSTPCGAMYLGNLKIGQTYSLQQCLGFPFNVTYNGQSMADIKLELQAPTTTSADGFEPIPDLKWVSIQKDNFSLDPGQTAETDALITIPNDEKLMGKKYRILIYPYSGVPKESGPGIAFGVGLKCKLDLEIAAKPPSAQEIMNIRKQQLGGVVSVLVTPERMFLMDFPLGKKVNIKSKYNETIKIVNSSDRKLKITLKSLNVVKDGFFAPAGYKEAENPEWLTFSKSDIIINKNSIKEIPVFINIPEDKKGEKWYFIVSVDVNSEIRNVRYYTRIYVEPVK
ncbi:MAG: hypothetical protein A2252_11020 [Elusimicrobia bacterium RIFOXYA2_FULL_39_19]|nr:MAG: hypothetical protein A2252_11020 [Elusimicrobia bacterium RIFOXYA2_FULL_39_19]